MDEAVKNINEPKSAYEAIKNKIKLLQGQIKK